MYKLLIVDDNYMQIQSLLHYLDWESFGVSEIRTAQDGNEGLAVFNSFLPDIVITDVLMPEMDGIELTKQIRKLNSKTKFIFISCYEDFKYLKEAMENEVVSYVLKPIDPKVLEKSVCKLLGMKEYEKKYDSMNTLLKESMDIYRKNFFYRLIYSKYIDVDYLKSTLHNLEFDNYKTFIIAKVDIVNAKNRFIDIYNLLNLTENDLFIKEHGMVVVENETRMIAMFMGKQADKEKFLMSIKIILDQYRTIVKQEYNIILNIGLSRVHDKLYNAPTLLEEASCALENNFSLRDDGVYVYDDLEYMHPSFNILELKDALNELINKNTTEQINLFINTFCPENAYFNNYAAKTLSICVFTVLQILLIERNLTGEDMLHNLTVIWNQINMMEKVDDVRNWLTDVLKSTLELIYIKEEDDYEKLIRDINEQLNKNFKNITSIAQIAANLYISESYARKIYKKYTGETIFEALFVKRMEEAKKMLADPKMKTYEVAEFVGYKSKQYFIEAFKRYTGCLPKDYSSKTIRKD